jgi:hypothetical protein
MDKQTNTGLPKSLEEAFDLATENIEQWELDRIHQALTMDAILLDFHVTKAAVDDGFSVDELYTVILRGTPVSKDTSTSINRRRQPGINYQGQISDGRTVELKVTFSAGWYRIATAYVKGRSRRR